MIDCHAHAFPPLGELVAKLPLGAQMAPLLERMASLASLASPHIGIAQLAALRARGPESLHRAAELLLSLGLVPQIVAAGTLDDLEASMERAGITRTIVIAAPPTAPNAWLLGAARAHPRIIPVVTLPEVDAGAGEEEWAAAFRALVAEGARGFKIHPNVDALAPEHPAYRALFAVARAERRFVILHTGCFCVLGYRDLTPADPVRFEPLFAAHREVPVCLAHMNRDHPEAAWELMRRHEQLWADTSWQPADVVARAAVAVGARRLLLGSDWPLLHGNLQADALDNLRRGVPDALEQVGAHNARIFVGES
jgi:predicted TIM-barrel fold metal-dependent hydrolase